MDKETLEGVGKFALVGLVVLAVTAIFWLPQDLLTGNTVNLELSTVKASCAVIVNNKQQDIPCFRTGSKNSHSYQEAEGKLRYMYCKTSNPPSISGCEFGVQYCSMYNEQKLVPCNFLEEQSFELRDNQEKLIECHEPGEPVARACEFL
jgi:hypothetical protein